jgi:hypothetical protein
MSKNLVRYARAVALLAAFGEMLAAQSSSPHDAWLMQNYRFTGPPAPRTVQPADPIVSELWRIQNQITWMMRRAKSDEDYEAALAAAAQASANIQVIETLMEQRAAAAAQSKSTSEQAASHNPAAPYLIALRDHTVDLATKYWIEGPLLHYLTPSGAHVQVRLDFVDRDLSARLNQEAKLDFRLPQ